MLFHPRVRLLKLYSAYYESRIANADISEVKTRSVPNVIISLTSYGDRLKTCHLAIRSILLQSVVPEKIILYIGNESADICLPRQLLDLCNYGLEIRRNVHDLGPHKKYYYAMSEHPDKIVITVDDDVMYPPETLKRLLDSHQLFPESVIAGRVNKIVIKDGRVAPYSEWIQGWRDAAPQPRKSLIATGVGGVLYPPYFASLDLLNMDAIAAYAKYEDDLWLKCYETKREIGIAWAPGKRVHPITIRGTDSTGLWNINVKNGGNDRALSNLMNYCKIDPVDFMD